MKIFGETQNTTANSFNQLFRSFFAGIDSVCFWLLGVMYQLFFNVATADLFNSEIILDFYKRFQLIIGVFMIFQLALLILRGIMDPDQVTDKKSGAGTFIKRVIIALTLLTVLTPISIPNPANDYERQINNNGLLFGTLYSLQERILENNTLGRLILGTNNAYGSGEEASTDTGVDSSTKESEDLKEASDVFASTILKGFVRINLHPKWEEYYVDNGKQPETQNECRMCKQMSDEAINEYKKLDADPEKILNMVSDETCKPDNIETDRKNKSRFAFTYRPVIAGAVAIFFAFILLSFSIDVVMRGIKLVILRLLAPIPIISYMDPKGSKDSALSAWTKQLISTYLDLFIRISIVYFALALIQDMMKKGIGMNTGDGLIAVLSYVIIFLGVFAFAKEAPKFIREVLGMKGDGGKLFGGLSAALGVAGRTAAIGAAGVGAIGAFNAARVASREIDKANNPGKEDRTINRGKHLLAGMAGGAAGLGTGIKTAITAKDKPLKTSFDAMQKRNADVLAKGYSGSTRGGRMATNLHRALWGESQYEDQTREISGLRAKEKTGKDLFSYLEGKGKTDGADFKINTTFDKKDKNGNKIGEVKLENVSLNEFNRALQKTKSDYARDGKTEKFTIGNHTFNIHDADISKAADEIAYAAGYEYAKGNMTTDEGLKQKLASYKDAGGQFGVYQETDETGKLVTKEVSVSQLKKDVKKAGGAATRIETDAEYARNKANHGATGGK